MTRRVSRRPWKEDAVVFAVTVAQEESIVKYSRKRSEKVIVMLGLAGRFGLRAIATETTANRIKICSRRHGWTVQRVLRVNGGRAVGGHCRMCRNFEGGDDEKLDFC